MVVLSGMQLLCEASWCPEVLDEIQPQMQELAEVLGVIWAWGRISDSFPHCFYYTAFPGDLSGDPHCYVEGGSTDPARLGCTRALTICVASNCPYLGQLQVPAALSSVQQSCPGDLLIPFKVH